MKTALVLLGCLLLATVIFAPIWGHGENSPPQPAQGQNAPPTGQNSPPAHPGSINYVEGQGSIGGESLTPNSVGSASLNAGQTLTTENGKIEVLLTPGVFLRVGENSAVKMISPDLTNTEVELDKGRAMVEALDVHKENNIRIDQNGVSTQLTKNGLYDFDADHQEIRVFKGTAEVYAKGQTVKIGGEHEVALDTSGKLKAKGFDTRQNEDDLFRWSALRSGYLSEAGVDEARVYIGGPGPGWYGPGWFGAGWYWDADFGLWTFIPADGIFYSPFGWGFYSPIFVYHSPFYYGRGRLGPHRFGDFHEPYGHGFEPRGGFHGGGGFRGSSGGMGGGGFHGGGGGGGAHR